MKKVNKYWTFLEDLLAGTFFASGITLVFYGVLMRYVFKEPKAWVTEVSIYVLIWAALLGISVALRNNQHIQIDIIYELVSDKYKKVMDIFSTLVGILFCAFYIYYGFSLVISRFESGLVSLDVGLPMWLVYTILPISGIMFLIRFIERLVNVIRKKEVNYDSSTI